MFFPSNLLAQIPIVVNKEPSIPAVKQEVYTGLIIMFRNLFVSRRYES
jgi:hypothetical protein